MYFVFNFIKKIECFTHSYTHTDTNFGSILVRIIGYLRLIKSVKDIN